MSKIKKTKDVISSNIEDVRWKMKGRPHPVKKDHTCPCCDGARVIPGYVGEEICPVCRGSGRSNL